MVSLAMLYAFLVIQLENHSGCDCSCATRIFIVGVIATALAVTLTVYLLPSQSNSILSGGVNAFGGEGAT